MSDPDAHILVVDDDDRIRVLLRRYLAETGYRVTAAAHAAAADRLIGSVDFDLVILDIMMPGQSGLAFLSQIREAGDTTPVVLLTARDGVEDRLEGLKRGADDYLPKPFEPEELALRIAAILRRARETDRGGGVVALGELAFHPKRAELLRGDERIRLTEAELQLLTALAKRKGEAVSRKKLAALTSSGLERSVDVQVTRLRRKIEPDPREPVHLQTVRGVGYRLVPG